MEIHLQLLYVILYVKQKMFKAPNMVNEAKSVEFSLDKQNNNFFLFRFLFQNMYVLRKQYPMAPTSYPFFIFFSFVVTVRLLLVPSTTLSSFCIAKDYLARFKFRK